MSTKGAPANSLFIFFKLIRVSNWIKNVVIFFPLLFGAQLGNREALLTCILGALVFCLLASAVYILNDIADAESDRMHPTKQFRPIASKQVPIPYAIATVVFLLVSAGSISFIFLPREAWAWLIAYFVLNLLYSYKLKHIGLLDVFMISSFFEIRLFLGGALSAVTISHWLSMLTFFLAAFIAFGKRYDDVSLRGDDQKNIRKSTKDYNLEFLNALLLLLATTILIIYLLYSISDSGGLHFNQNFYVTGLFVFLGICRYLQLTFVFRRGGNPVAIFYSDKLLMFCWAGWLISVIYFVYF